MRDFFVFFNSSYTWRDIRDVYGIAISDSFLNCANNQLKLNFEKQTGIKVKNKKCCISIFSVDHFQYSKEKTSSLDIGVVINNDSSMAKICWNSKSNRIYELSDEDIDCEDIKFWFEYLNPLLYHRQLNPKEALPFKISKPYFGLEINHIMVDFVICISFISSTFEDIKLIIDKINNLINNWNKRTEKEDYIQETQSKDYYDSKGVVHNLSISKIEANYCELSIDLGSADVIIIKKIIQLLDKEKGILKVLIE